MADQDRTPPDLLGSLLSGKKQETSRIPEDHKAGIPESQKIIKPAKKRQPASRPAHPPKVKTKEAPTPGDKIKATFYISTEISEALELGWIQLRTLTPKKQRGQVSKSLIVELSLQETLQDLRNEQTNSRLVLKTRGHK